MVEYVRTTVSISQYSSGDASGSGHVVTSLRVIGASPKNASCFALWPSRRTDRRLSMMFHWLFVFLL